MIHSKSFKYLILGSAILIASMILVPVSYDYAGIVFLVGATISIYSITQIK